MKSLPATGGLKTAMVITAAAIFATGCCTAKKTTTAQYPPAPVVENQGAAPVAVQTETATATSMPGNEVVIPLHKEQLTVGTAQTEQGAVQIRKEVKTETVTKPVEVRRETVSVERLPAGSAQANAAPTQGDLNTPFKSGEMTINLHQEQPIAETQTVPAGAVVIHKQITSEPVNIQRQVRREEVTAVPTGNSKNVTISGDLSGQGGAPYATGQATGQGGTITDWRQFKAKPDPTAFAGYQVNLTNVKVQRQVSDRLLAIGPDSGQPMYLESNKPLSGITPGSYVDVRGTVETVPQDTSTLGLDAQSASALHGQAVYIMGDATPRNQ